MCYNKYKDALPNDTITKIQEILKSLGIVMNEKLNHPTQHLYSMRIQSEKLEWGTNGKGTTEVYCRASAYGEAMERLENLHLPDWLMDDMGETQENGYSFRYYPDEKQDNLEDCIKNIRGLAADMRQSYYESDHMMPTDEQLCKIWNGWNENRRFTFLPFYNVSTNKTEDLPFEVIRKLCRSNGIASGNTIEEAICQALSEILERYVQQKLFTEQLTPPEIPDEYIQRESPELFETIKEIEKKGAFRILVLDGSLNKNLPVVCTILVDNENQRYRVKFGCHPIFFIALERCLTEMAQGNDFGANCNERQMTQWTRYNQKKWDTLNNWSSMFRSNIGSIPSSFFYTEPSWIFKEWEQPSDFTNKAGTQWLINLCKSLSADIFIRETGFLGFPSVRVYIPGITKVYKFNPLGQKNPITKDLKRIINNFPDYADIISTDEKKQLIEVFKDDYHCILSERLGVSVPLLLGALYADLGEFELALNSLKRIDKPTKYIQAVIREMEMREDNIDKKDRDRMINLFFGEKYTTYIILNWRNGNITGGLFDPYRAKKIRKEVEKMNNNGTQSNAFRMLYYQLKKRMLEWNFDQEHLKKLLISR